MCLSTRRAGEHSSKWEEKDLCPPAAILQADTTMRLERKDNEILTRQSPSRGSGGTPSSADESRRSSELSPRHAVGHVDQSCDEGATC